MTIAPDSRSPAARRGRTTASAALLGLCLASAACGDAAPGPVAPHTSDVARGCGATVASASCPTYAALDSARTIVLDAAARGAPALEAGTARRAVLELLDRLALALERRDVPAARQWHAELRSTVTAAEASAAQGGSPDWPDLVALQLAVDHVGRTLAPEGR